jgi:hypothetical protein
MSEFLSLACIARSRPGIFASVNAGTLVLPFFYDFILALTIRRIADLVRHDTIFLVTFGVQNKSIFVEDDV